MKSLGPLVCAVAALSACAPGVSCGGKQPIADINAGFTLADASWFEDEQTLFIFYSVSAEQGVSGRMSQGNDREEMLPTLIHYLTGDFRPTSIRQRVK